jgi:xylulokinase
MAYFLTVDIGTAGCKILLFNQSGNVMAKGYEEYPTYILGSTIIEQDPNEWWESTCRGIKKVLDIASVPAEELRGVGCAGHFPTLVLVDKNGKALRRAILYSDMRAEKQSKEIFERCGTEISRLVGQPKSLFPGLPVAKLLWLRENEPKLTKSILKVLGAKDFINFRLTGNVAVDYLEACWTGLANSTSYSWMEEIAQELNLPREWFGEIHRPQEIIGEVTEQASASTGLRKGTPVICGSGDGMCNVIGTGLLEPGVTMDSAGATEIIAAISNNRLPDSESESLTGWLHPNSQAWIIYTSTSTAGLALKWFKDQFVQFRVQGVALEKAGPYQLLDNMAQEAPAGSGKVIFLPYLAGEYAPFFDLNARGVFFGISLETERTHLARAVMEGVAFSLRHILENFESIGIGTRAIRTSGGGSRSRPWNQIKADVTGKPVSTLEVAETACLGAAILASVAVEVHSSFQTATQSMVRIADTAQPNYENHEKYSKLFEIYKEIYINLKGVFSKTTAL